MPRLLNYPFYKRGAIKAFLIILIIVTVLYFFYFSLYYLSTTKSFHKNFAWSTTTDGKKAWIQLDSKVRLKTGGVKDDQSYTLHTAPSGKKSLKHETLDGSIKTVNVSRESHYQATLVNQVNVEDQIGDQVKSKDNRDNDLQNLSEVIKPKTSRNYGCPRITLGLGSIPASSYGKCKPHIASSEACKEAQKLYYLDPAMCEDQYEQDICSLRVLRNNNQKILKAHCNRKVCREGDNSVIVKCLNPENGKHDILHTFSYIRKLEKELPLIMKQSGRHKFNYVFLQCKGKGVDRKVVQLLPLDPHFTVKENSTAPRDKRLLNVNIILIDSVSRAHFYRSLPKTINLFKRWTEDRILSPARVFDFELFQAVEGHTAENTHALFTGQLFPKSNDANQPVGMETLFGHYRKAGYQTSWQEDLCWEGKWGLFVDMALQYDWKNLAPALKERFIDSTGITHSSCEVLKKYGIETPFNGPAEHRICYNGKFQHSYFLEYNQNTLKAIASNPRALPYLSYMSLSVGHDQYGRRIQTFDEAFSQFAETVAHDPNTITIVLADHGNTYTQYTVTIQEGRFEIFHPSLFVILPNGVVEKIGKDAINSLTLNQRRLVTMIDLHKSLMTLARPVPTRGIVPKGIFTPVSSERTCDSVELRTPNLCVCEGWDSPTTNDTLKLDMVEFAVGQLNNKLQGWFVENHRGFPLTRSCGRLHVRGFNNVRERNFAGSLITSFDILVSAGDVAPHEQDTFRAEVKTTLSPSSASLDMKLVQFERVSMFAPYRACADKGINVKLCVCSKGTPTAEINLPERLKNLMTKETSCIDSEVTYRTLDEEGCLTLIERIHGKKDVYAYELANTCLSQSYTVVLDMTDIYNINMSSGGPIKTTIAPGSIRFVFSARKRIQYYDGNILVQVTSIQ